MSDFSTIYTPRRMVQALRQTNVPPMFLYDLFNRRVNTLETDTIEIDIEKNGREIAAYVSRVGDPHSVKKDGFSTNIHVAPYLYEEVSYTAKDMKIRMPGEDAYSGMSPAQRRDQKVAMWLQDLRYRFMRRKEQQLAEGVQTGKVQVSGKDVEYLVDFQMDPNHLQTNTAADIWGSGTEDKINQLEALSGTIRDTGAPGPTTVVMGTDAANLFLKDEAVLKYLDNRRVEMGGINPRQLARQTATYLGDFRRIGLDVEIYSYSGKYRDTDGSVKSYVDPDNVVLGSTAARVETHFGMIENLHHGSFVGEEFPWMHVDANGRKGHLSMESAPLVAVHQPDSFARLTVK